VHCLRKGTVTLVNAVGAQVADDRSLLAFAPQIIRFYLSETAILPTVPTFWLGDIDQREMVLESLADFHIRPVVPGERRRVLGARAARRRRRLARNDPARTRPFRRAAKGRGRKHRLF
jgi:uncharacterized circularly permuted ATP-grasp superfamily protein